MIANLLSVPVVAEPRLLDIYMKALSRHVMGETSPDSLVKDHKRNSGVGIITGEHNGIGIMEISGTMVPRAMEMDTNLRVTVPEIVNDDIIESLFEKSPN